MLNFKALVSASLGRAGLELRKLKSHHVDLFGDQKRLLSDEPVRVIFDLGASDGSTALIYRSLLPEATIYSFEPTNPVFEALRRRFAGDPKVVPIHAAVGRLSGTASLFVNAFDQTNSLLPASTDPGNVAGSGIINVATQDVPLVALDAFCGERGIDKIDILKMDIQGFELNALQGARQMLEKQAIRLIYTEVLFGRMYQGQAFYHDLAAYLQEFGYDLYGLYSLMRSENGVLSHADAVFMSRAVREKLR